MSREFTIKVPASSANIGPGFDVLGIGLNLYLTLSVQINEKSPSEKSQKDPYNVDLSYLGSGNEGQIILHFEDRVSGTNEFCLSVAV